LRFYGPRKIIEGLKMKLATTHIDRRALLIGTVATLFTAPAALAAGRIAFDAAAFQAARDGGQTVVLEVTAKWCGPCKRQRPVVAKLLEEPDFARLTVFDADYDLHKAELVRLKALQLTTLIIYKGAAEIERSSGETRPETVRAFLQKAL
jgi:thioredoxin 1